MDIKFDHREESPNYFLDLTVVLSEEEAAIIRSRGLVDQLAMTLPGSLRPQILGGSRANITALRVGAFVVGIGGFILFFEAGMLFIFIGVAMYIASFFMQKDTERAESERHISLGDLLITQEFTIWCHDPVDMKMNEEEILEKLTAVKNFIEGSATIAEGRTIHI